jgi:NTE family protein
LDQDALRLERLNDLLRKLPPADRDNLRPVELLVLRPSVDLARLAHEFEPQLPKTFRFLTRGLGTRQTKSPDFLSMVLFQPDYIAPLIDIGEEDAKARADEIDAFIRTGNSSAAGDGSDPTV